MAVEPKRIKDRLKALFPKANLSTTRMDAIADRLSKKPADDAEDSAIDEVLNNANDFMPFEDIAREDDKLRTLEAKSKGKSDPPKDDPKDDPKKEDPKTDDDTPAWAKTMAEQNAKLFAKVEALEKGKVTETKRDTARKLFEKSEALKGLKDSVKDRWFNRINLESETSFEDQIKELEEEHSELVQDRANSRSFGTPPPSGGKNDGQMSDERLDKIADNL